MKLSEKKDERLFGQNFWKTEGGEKWVTHIDLLEGELAHLDRILLEHCHITPGETILDVGCGGGITSLALAEQTGPTGKVLGIDVSAIILDVAKKRGKDVKNIEFKLGDAGRDDLGEGTFDLVTSRFGLMFFDRPVEAFRNLRRMLKPDGRMVFICWRTFAENPWMAEPAAAVFSVIPPPENPPAPEPDDPGPFSLGERERLRFVLEKAGLRDITLAALDTEMNLGDMDEAVYMASQIGPAARAIGDATEEKRTAAENAIQKMLDQYQTADGVILSGACWMVSAVK